MKKKLNNFYILSLFKSSSIIKKYNGAVKYLYSHMLFEGDFFMPWIKVSIEVKRQLEYLSEKTGLSEYDLANTYLSNALKDKVKESKKGMNPEELEKILDHDLPEGDWVSKRLIGLADFDGVTDAVELKKNSYKRGK